MEPPSQVDRLEDEFHINLSEPVDLEELCKPESKGVEFEVCQPVESTEKNYFDEEEVFKQLNREMMDPDDDEPGDEHLSPFEKISRRMRPIIGDGGVMKRVIKVGSGEVIGQSDTATVHYNGYLEYSDDPYDSTRLRNRPEKYRLGEGKVIEGLDVAISTMRKGEISQFLVKPEYAFGAMGVPPRIPENASILFEVELVNIMDNPVAGEFDTWTVERRKMATFSEILNVANAERKSGNELYQNKLFSKASYHYGKAIRLLEEARLADESEEDEMKRVLLKLLLNSALCNIKLCNSTRALSNCMKALDIDHNNVKAMFRRGQAFLQLSDFEKAQKWLSKAQKQCPNDTAIVKEIAKLHTARKTFKQMEQSMYTKMFPSATKSANKENNTSKTQDGSSGLDKQKMCPAETQELLKKRLKAFDEDKALTEMPIALETLTSAEVDYIQQAATEMGLLVRKLNQNSDKYLKLYKPKQEENP
ncbi:inactive peptidyl-prolyl cis-trans isomerase FKBP6-like [Asterias amurensis]|uniref:inactive peptidyl-prolyl cis-trans isomerase FKBP6-like n=1 Tax=Asterias amurensis TaxID=7602 RepID=UPI003AB22ED0